MPIKYKSGYKYQLYETYKYKHPEFLGISLLTEWVSIQQGTLIIRRHYAWDGPSGPTIDTRSFMRASLVHDALYQLMRETHLQQSFREKADRIMIQICKEDGMCAIRRFWVRIAVRKFAKKAASHHHQKKIRIAP